MGTDGIRPSQICYEVLPFVFVPRIYLGTMAMHDVAAVVYFTEYLSMLFSA